MRIISTVALTLTTLLSGAPAHAEWFGVIGLALTQGGDAVAQVSYTKGTTDTLRLGEQAELRMGAAYLFDKTRWRTQLTVGYQKVSNATDQGSVTTVVFPHAQSNLKGNVSVSYSQVPVDWLLLYDLNDDWRLGAGLRRVLNARVNTEATGTSLGDFEFKASTRPVLQANWLINQRIGVYLRHARTSYRYSSSQGSVKLDGTQTALGIDFWF